jgi:hypothetical protein
MVFLEMKNCTSSLNKKHVVEKHSSLFYRGVSDEKRNIFVTLPVPGIDDMSSDEEMFRQLSKVVAPEKYSSLQPLIEGPTL